MNFSFTPRPLYPPGKQPPAPIEQKTGWASEPVCRRSNPRLLGRSAHSPVTTPSALFWFCSHHKPPESYPHPSILYLSNQLNIILKFMHAFLLHPHHHVLSQLLIISGERVQTLKLFIMQPFSASSYCFPLCPKIILREYVNYSIIPLPIGRI